LGLVILATTNFGSNALKLMKESRTEIRRVVWPTRIETTQTFLVVFGSIIVKQNLGDENKEKIYKKRKNVKLKK